VISLDEQLQNHRIIISLITEALGNKDSAMKHLNKCIYTIDMGNNDYTMNYFLPQLYNTSRQFSAHQYATVLIQQYSQQLEVIATVLYVTASNSRHVNIYFIWCMVYIYTAELIRSWSKEGGCCGTNSKWLLAQCTGNIWYEWLFMCRGDQQRSTNLQ